MNFHNARAAPREHRLSAESCDDPAMGARCRLAACSAAVLVMAACGSEPAPPGPPTGPASRTIVGWTVDGATSIKVGETTTLTATAYWSDGTVTLASTAIWSSQNPAVASVTPAGLVTGVSEGLANLSARYAGSTVGAQVRVTPLNPPPTGLHAIEGRVHGVPPSAHIGIAGATVRISQLGTTGADRFATTDAGGRFSIALETGPYAFLITHPDYFFLNRGVDVVDAIELEFALRPSPGELTEVFALTRGLPPVSQASVSYPIHLSGVLKFRLLRACLDDTCGPTRTADACVEARDGAGILVAQRRIPLGDTSQTPSAPIQGGQIYTIKLYACEPGSFRGAAPGIVFREFALEIKRPK